MTRLASRRLNGPVPGLTLQHEPSITFFLLSSFSAQKKAHVYRQQLSQAALQSLQKYGLTATSEAASMSQSHASPASPSQPPPPLNGQQQGAPETAYENPAHLLGVYPFLKYQPTARGELSSCLTKSYSSTMQSPNTSLHTLSLTRSLLPPPSCTRSTHKLSNGSISPGRPMTMR